MPDAAGCRWDVEMQDPKDRRFSRYSDKVPQWRLFVDIVAKYQLHQIESIWGDCVEYDWIRSLVQQPTRRLRRGLGGREGWGGGASWTHDRIE